MPITQSRLLRLISAGEHFRDTAATLRAAFNTKCTLLFNHTITFEQAFAELNTELNTFTHYDSEATSVLSEERTRYNITHKRNAIEKRRIYNKRHPTSPQLSAPSPKPSIAQVAAAVDATDEAFDGLSDLADEAVGPSTPDAVPFDEPTPADIYAAVERALRDQDKDQQP